MRDPTPASVCTPHETVLEESSSGRRPERHRLTVKGGALTSWGFALLVP
jgi:hypothetical protein